MLDQTKTIEQIEQDIWSDPDSDATSLIKTCHALRKKPLKDFTPRDLQLMISQGNNFALLMPKALDILETNPLIEADTFYPGHLLKTVLSLHKTAQFWDMNSVLAHKAVSITQHARTLLTPASDNELSITHDIHQHLDITLGQFLDHYGAK